MQKARGSGERRREWITQGGEAASLGSMDLFVVPPPLSPQLVYLAASVHTSFFFVLLRALLLPDEP